MDVRVEQARQDVAALGVEHLRIAGRGLVLEDGRHACHRG